MRTRSLNESGATTVETSVTVFPFMLIMIGIIQLTLLSVSLSSMQFALNRAARWGLIGNIMDNQTTREGSITKKFQDTAAILPIDVSDVSVYICSTANPNCTSSNATGSGQFMVLRAVKPVQYFFGLGSFELSARLLVRNEPF